MFQESSQHCGPTVHLSGMSGIPKTPPKLPFQLIASEPHLDHTNITNFPLAHLINQRYLHLPCFPCPCPIYPFSPQQSTSDDGAEELDMDNVGGVFFVLFVGCSFASLFGCCELFFVIAHRARRHKVTLANWLRYMCCVCVRPGHRIVHLKKASGKRTLTPTTKLWTCVCVCVCMRECCAYGSFVLGVGEL